jgi:inner membrane transporter RhtA
VASSVLPYSRNLEALRRIPPRVFGVLTSLEPAAGAGFGLVILGQRLAGPQWLGIAAVAFASVAATCLGAGKRQDGDSRVLEKRTPPAAPAARHATDDAPVTVD